MSEQIADGNETDAGTDQMSCKGVAHTMRRKTNADAAALSPRAHAFINSAT